MFNRIKRGLRGLTYWAFELGPNECFVIDNGEGYYPVNDLPALKQEAEVFTQLEPTALTASAMQLYMEKHGASFFCKARPGLPGEIEHIHQMPNTEADQQRAKDFGFMVADACLIPATPFVFFDGNGVFGRGD